MTEINKARKDSKLMPHQQQNHIIKAKATYTASQAAHCSGSGAVHHRHSRLAA